MKFVDNNEEELLPHRVEYIGCGMQAIIGKEQRTLKHDLESLEGVIELWIYEHLDCTKVDVDFTIQHLDPNMLQDIPNNLDVYGGQCCEDNMLMTLWCHYVCEILDLLERFAY